MGSFWGAVDHCYFRGETNPPFRATQIAMVRARCSRENERLSSARGPVPPKTVLANPSRSRQNYFGYVGRCWEGVAQQPILPWNYLPSRRFSFL